MFKQVSSKLLADVAILFIEVEFFNDIGLLRVDSQQQHFLNPVFPLRFHFCYHLILNERDLGYELFVLVTSVSQQFCDFYNLHVLAPVVVFGTGGAGALPAIIGLFCLALSITAEVLSIKIGLALEIRLFDLKIRL